MANASRTGEKVATGLHVCPECGSAMVQPTRWEQADERGHWHLWRRCPECEWSCDAVHGEGEIDCFDEALDRGTEILTEDLRTIVRENMEWVADTLAAALAADLITADDFS
ncbi:MAG TPA: hypothetical protein VGF09_06630 [Solirubrobacterales bacterium]|jgi:hypothetical protein